MDKNTKIVYLYRDAGNYKSFNEIVVKGKIEEKDILPFLKDNSYFIPSEVGLSDLQPSNFTKDDHIWHEIEFIVFTQEDTTIDISNYSLLENFKKANKNNWNEYAVFESKGLV